MKRNVLKKRVLLATLLLTVSALSFQARAQVTIGSGEEPDPDALLDLKSGVGSDDDASNKGLLLPRVTLGSTASAAPLANHVEGMYVYNTNTTTGTNSVTPGIYYNDGEKWVRENSPKWFYLPSFNLDLNVAAEGDTKTVNLYTDVYQKQGTRAGNTKYVVSAGAPGTPGTFDFATNKPLYAPDQLVFVVTDYDNTVISIANNGIDADGVMTYTVNDTDPPAGAYINIICVVK